MKAPSLEAQRRAAARRAFHARCALLIAGVDTRGVFSGEAQAEELAREAIAKARVSAQLASPGGSDA